LVGERIGAIEVLNRGIHTIVENVARKRTVQRLGSHDKHEQVVFSIGSGKRNRGRGVFIERYRFGESDRCLVRSNGESHRGST
jgi:hypothetical protein